ncbi:hypothetical protein K501DRAFT_332253 [Backusella circina FSU 941]|nr:hypothetical protein K501DRAFT_332253 [Backusella circina FSU 941]
MPHPLVLGAIVVGGVVVLWGGYEIASKIYREHRDREEYQEYIREYNNREKFSDNDDDDEPLINTIRRGSNNGLRNRRRFSASSDDKVSNEEFELSEMESSILERKHRLEQEQAFLDKQEELLKARRSALFQDLETDVAQTNHLVIQDNPMTFNPFSTDFEDEDDQTKNFQPNLINNNQDDHNDESTSKEITPVTNNEDLSEQEDNTNNDSLTSSSELRFPRAPRFPASDSEESWDAVTDEWNHTDSEESFADPMFSDDNLDIR